MPPSEKSAAAAEQPRSFGFETRMLHAGHIPGRRRSARGRSRSTRPRRLSSTTPSWPRSSSSSASTATSTPASATRPPPCSRSDRFAGRRHRGRRTSSGMAAQFVALMTLLSPGDEIVSSSHLYGGTVTQFTHTFKKLSIKVLFVDPTGSTTGSRRSRQDARALRRDDRQPARQHSRLAALADSSPTRSAPPDRGQHLRHTVSLPPIEHGATIVIHSATKFIGGHGNSIGGVIADPARSTTRAFPPSPARLRRITASGSTTPLGTTAT